MVDKPFNLYLAEKPLAGGIASIPGLTAAGAVGRIAAPVTPLSHFGVRSVEQGITANQATNLIDALESGYVVDGQGMTYNFALNLQPAAGSFKGLVNVKLKLLSQSATNRALRLDNQTDFTLSNVLVEGDDDRDTGSISNTSLVWIDGCDNFIADNLRVTRGGPGSGISIQTSDRFSLLNTRVWDMNYDVAAATDDVVQGLWLNACADFSIINPQVFDFTGEIAGVASRRFTRGIAIGGCSTWNLHGGFNRTVDQGLDVTGSAGNKDFTINGHVSRDAYTWAFKFANTARRGRITGCVAHTPGLSGFACSAPTAGGVSLDLVTSDLTFDNCLAVNPGTNTEVLPGSNVRNGFIIMSATAEYDQNVQGIKFVNCEAIDDQAVPTMEYGALCGVPHTGASSFRRNELIDFRSRGHTAARQTGFHFARAEITGTSTQSIATSGTITSVDLQAEVEDTCLMHNISANRSQIDIWEDGVWEIDLTVEFAANATGLRGVGIWNATASVYLNGGLTYIDNAGASLPTIGVFRWCGRIVKDTALDMRCYQASGGALDINRANSRCTVRKVGDY